MSLELRVRNELSDSLRVSGLCDRASPCAPLDVVPSDNRSPVAARQVIGVGETYDFEIEVPPGRRTLWVEVRTTGGRWHTQGRVIVK